MARLTTEQRKSMSPSEYALPGKRFPLNDKTHEEKAIQLAPTSLHAGNISKAQEQEVIRKANAKLHRKQMANALRSK